MTDQAHRDALARAVAGDDVCFKCGAHLTLADEPAMLLRKVDGRSRPVGLVHRECRAGGVPVAS